MSELTALCTSLKNHVPSRDYDPSQPSRCWREHDVLNNKIADAYVMILRTRGCSWAHASGCTMCGYWNDSVGHEVSERDLLHQFQQALERYTGEKIVKIFTSGSFFDEQEIPSKVRIHILKELSQTTEKIIVESRPLYVTVKTLTDAEKVLSKKQLEVGIGLETSSDFIRTKAVNKGFSFEQYKKAARLLYHHEFLVKTYVLVKPPFLTEHEAMQDSIQTIQDSALYSDTISINPTNVQRHTLVEYLWKRHQYRPPWLWSIIDILKQGKKQTNARLQCDISGGGSSRGPHNCTSCDQKILQAIADFSLHQKPKVFDHLTCSCQEQWQDQLDCESLSFGSCVDFSRWSV